MGNKGSSGRMAAAATSKQRNQPKTSNSDGAPSLRSSTLSVKTASPEKRQKISVKIKRIDSTESPNSASRAVGRSLSVEKDKNRIISFRKNNVEKFTLTVADIRHLQKTYKEETVNRGNQHPGDTIFQHIVARVPPTKFCYEKKQRDDDKALDMPFHYVKISEVMDFAMEHLEDPALVSALLRKTGADHVRFRKYGFEADFWKSLGDAFLHCSLHWGHTRQTEKQRDCWFNVFWFITEELKTGYQQTVDAEKNPNRKSAQVAVVTKTSGGRHVTHVNL